MIFIYYKLINNTFIFFDNYFIVFTFNRKYNLIYLDIKFYLRKN